MTNMDITQLDQELRSGKIRPCYLLVGTERHLILTSQRQILKSIFRDSAEEVDRFQAGQHSLRTILDCLKTPSLLALWRLVLVEEAGRFKKQDWEHLKNFFDKPIEKAVLILVAEALSDGVLKTLLPSVCIVDCKKIYPRQVTSWINIEVKRLGFSISQEAAKFLADCVGADLGSLSQALEKLRLFVGSKKLMDLQDVEQAIADTSQKSIFDLTNAVGEKNFKRATGLLNQILEQGEEPLRVFAMIVRHFRLLAKAQELLEKLKEAKEADFAKTLKVHPFFAKDYAAQARRFNKEAWPKRFASLTQCDRFLKGSRLKPQAVLEKLIWELCGS